MNESQEFHEERLTGIGGSDMPMICGKSSFGGPSKVYMQKLGLELPGESNNRMEAGHRLEPIIAEWFADQRGLKVSKPAGMLRHPDYPWMICHLDGFTYNGSDVPKRPLEIKNVAGDMAYLWGSADDAIPESVIIQCQHNLFVASGHLGIDFDGCEVAALIGGNELRANLFVPRNEDLIKAIIGIGEEFWKEHVEKKIPPPIDGTDDCARLIATHFPNSNELSVAGDAVTNDAAAVLLKIRAEIKVLKVEETLRQNQIKTALGSAGVFMSDCGKFTWKRTKDGEKTNWKALAAHLGYTPEALVQFTEHKEGSRRFCCPRGK